MPGQVKSKQKKRAAFASPAPGPGPVQPKEESSGHRAAAPTTAVAPKITDVKGPGVAAFNAMSEALTRAGAPVDGISKWCGRIRLAAQKGEQPGIGIEAGYELPLMEGDVKFTSAQCIVWGKIAITHGYKLKFVVKTEGSIAESEHYNVDVHGARAARRGAETVEKMEDPNGGFNDVPFQRGEAKYESPVALMAEKVATVTKALKLAEPEAEAGAETLSQLLNAVLSNYSVRKGDPRPWVKTAVNTLLTVLSAAAALITSSNAKFSASNKGCLAAVLTADICNGATLVLQTKREDGIRGKFATSNMKLAAFAARLGINASVVDDVATKSLISRVSSVDAAKAPVVNAINFILMLAGDANRADRTEESSQTFRGMTYKAVGAAKDRTWVDYVITRRIERDTSLEVKPGYCKSVKEVVQHWVEIDGDDDTKYPKGYVEPALYGFRTYMPNLKGKMAKTAAKVVAAMGATVETQENGHVSRHEMLINKLSSIDLKSLDEYLTFIIRARSDEFLRILKLLE